MALDLAFDGSAIFGGDRSKRYALIVEDGKVKQAFVEPDNTGLSGELPTFFLFSFSIYLFLLSTSGVSSTLIVKLEGVSLSVLIFTSPRIVVSTAEKVLG